MKNKKLILKEIDICKEQLKKTTYEFMITNLNQKISTLYWVLDMEDERDINYE